MGDMNVEKEKKTKRPTLRFSVTHLDLKVEEGRVYRDSFTVESTNGVPVKGRVYSNCDKVGLDLCEFEGTAAEIRYYFKGKLSLAGEEFEGDFVLLTNGGEHNIPFRFVVTPNRVETSIGKISDMEGFTALYLANRREAMELFFQPNFAEVFLKGKEEEKAICHSLMKSRSKSLILEEFLTACGYKPAAQLCVPDKPLVLDAGMEKGELVIEMPEYGFLEGKIRCEKGQVQLSRDTFTSDDFTDGKLVVQVEKNQNYAVGNDVICIDTIRKAYEVGVEWWGTLPAYSKEREERSRIRRQQADLMHSYLYFRTGGVEYEDFAESAGRIVDDLYFLTKDPRWQLFRLHLSLMEERTDEAKEAVKDLEAREEAGGFDPLSHNYFLYLKAMLYRTPEAISQAVVSIRRLYEGSEYRAEALWMLIYLDREYVYNKRLQYDTIKQLFEAGCNSSLLYFEACEILNENPGYMEETGSFEVGVFRWGVRYGYVSLSLAFQFARLALRMKFFHRSIYYIAVKLYQVEPDERFLQVICSLLIKGNKTGKEYHVYFKKAVEANLKIVGLNEFFIRSMDYGSYEEIPQRVLIYFTYSNSLDSMEKAYLYCNVLHNRERYEEVYGAYYSKMPSFVEDQLVKGRMNEHLSRLYGFFRSEVLEKPENTRATCDILFYQKLVCRNKNMVGVYVDCPETGEERYYPFSGGVCYIKSWNRRTRLYFVDSAEQRYLSGVEYETEPFLSPEQFPKEWIRKNLSNKDILLMYSARVDEEADADDLVPLQKIAFDEAYLPWIRTRALERLLLYYQSHQKKEELSRWLTRSDYTKISPFFIKKLMDFYMEVGLIENAFFGVELYGCHLLGAAKSLKLAVFGVRYYGGEKDETTLYLCCDAFVRKKYNRDTLTYLMRHYEGELTDLLRIWEKSRKFSLDTAAFEKRILRQCIETGDHGKDVFPVFLSAYGADPEDETAAAYLAETALRAMEGRLVLPEELYVIVGECLGRGRLHDRRLKVDYLYHFADAERRTGWEERIRPQATALIDAFLKEEYYLPVYHAYGDWVSFPVPYAEFTFLTYDGTPGQEVVLRYEIEGEEDRTEERRLAEILPGKYVCRLHFFRSDHIHYQLEADGERVLDEDRIHFETFEYEGEDSRFFALNLLGEEDGMDRMHDYLMKSFFTDQYMRLM